jgi:signal transduction histidine kinase/CheY-like chemotaxis protein
MLVPLVVRGRRLGVLTLGLEGAARAFEPDTHAMVGELASRGATALDNALLFRKIQDEDQRKNEFLAMLAHELRNPLAPISNAVHIMRVSDDDAGKLAWARELIARQLKQLVRLVDDLLDVSRITRGKIELKIEPVDVEQVIREAIETSRPSIDAQRHTVSLQLPKEPLRVRGDYARIAQILSNLLNNAAKYTPRGGRVSLSATHEDAEAVFRVRDSGVGIPQEFLASIFDPFSEVDRSLARSHGGLGIGLTLVRRLVELQGGSVTVRSEGRNRGSEFTVRLPVAPAGDPAKAAAGAAAAQPVASPAGLRVLVVDDNHDVADSTASVMRMSGCDVHVAYDGKAALESVQRLRPDAVLLDIGLPAIDGYLVAEHIRAQPENGRTMIVAVSGYGQEQDRERSKSVGFDYHVVKPIDPAVLAGLVGSLRHTRDARDGGATQVPLSQGAR